MSDMLTHWAVFEQCRRLAKWANGIEPLFAEVMNAQVNYARFGAVTRGEGYWITPIIERAREDWKNPRRHSNIDRKLAMALAGLTHTACDHTMKPLLQRLVVGEEVRPNALDNPHRWIYAYQDAFVFREIYRGGDEGPFNLFFLAENNTAPGVALEEMIGSVFQGSMLTCHSMAPDLQSAILFCEVDGLERRQWTRWIDHLYLGSLPLYVDIQRLVEAYNRPDSELMKRFEMKTAFYRADDPSIMLALQVQNGGTVNPSELDEALDPAANKSAFGQAIAWGIENLRRATLFWNRKAATIPAENFNSIGFRDMLRRQRDSDSVDSSAQATGGKA